MRSMLAKHLTLTACRHPTILTKIVEANPMNYTFLGLLSTLYQIHHYRSQLIHEPSTVGQLPFDGLPTVRTFCLDMQTLRYTGLAVEFGAMGAHGGLACSAIADLTVQ